MRIGIPAAFVITVFLSLSPTVSARELTIPEPAPPAEVISAPEATSAPEQQERFDLRRRRASFQTRLSGGIDLARPTYGVGGMIQVGVGFTGSHYDNFDSHFVAPAWVGVEMRY